MCPCEHTRISTRHLRSSSEKRKRKREREKGGSFINKAHHKYPEYRARVSSRTSRRKRAFKINRREHVPPRTRSPSLFPSSTRSPPNLPSLSFDALEKCNYPFRTRVHSVAHGAFNVCKVHATWICRTYTCARTLYIRTCLYDPFTRPLKLATLDRRGPIMPLLLPLLLLRTGVSHPRNSLLEHPSQKGSLSLSLR